MQSPRRVCAVLHLLGHRPSSSCAQVFLAFLNRRTYSRSHIPPLSLEKVCLGGLALFLHRNQLSYPVKKQYLERFFSLLLLNLNILGGCAGGSWLSACYRFRFVRVNAHIYKCCHILPSYGIHPDSYPVDWKSQNEFSSQEQPELPFPAAVRNAGQLPFASRKLCQNLFSRRRHTKGRNPHSAQGV